MFHRLQQIVHVTLLPSYERLLLLSLLCTDIIYKNSIQKSDELLVYSKQKIYLRKKNVQGINKEANMDRQQTIQTIHDYMVGQPVVKAWIFGSFARGEDKPKSDIDILFVPDFEHGSFTLLTHGGMYEDLKQLLGREVDLVVDGSLRPYAKESAERDKILVYERAI